MCVCVHVSVRVSKVSIQSNIRLGIVFGGGGGWGSLQGDDVQDKFHSQGGPPLSFARGGQCPPGTAGEGAMKYSR